MILAQHDKLIRFNRSRADYLAKFEELIKAYNNGSRNIEQTLEYPPDKQEQATATVLQQAELLCADWAAYRLGRAGGEDGED